VSYEFYALIILALRIHLARDRVSWLSLREL